MRHGAAEPATNLECSLQLVICGRLVARASAASMVKQHGGIRRAASAGKSSSGASSPIKGGGVESGAC